MADPDGRDSGRKALIAVCLLLFVIGLVGVVNALKDGHKTDSPASSINKPHTSQPSDASPDSAARSAPDQSD